ncbi:MAG: DUF3137 domain-containing protein, partial [Clostridia bacterium]|nr:DUF3137 domain-containing protein [Clostridia bacterium]
MDIFKKLEVIRREILIFAVLSLILFLFGFVALAILPAGVSRTVFSAVSFGAFLATLGMIRLRVSAYKHLYSQHMLKHSMETEFDDVTYDPKAGLPSEVIASTDMIMMGNCYESSEYRTGRYRGTSFEMADVCLKSHFREGRRRSDITYFQGTWMVFTFEGHFCESLQVKEKSFMNAQKPKGEHPELDRVAVGSDELARFFKVYGESAAQAERFLSPELQKAILSLNYELPGDLMFYFYRDRLHIAIHGRHAQYEPPLLGRLYREEVERVLLSE